MGGKYYLFLFYAVFAAYQIQDVSSGNFLGDIWGALRGPDFVQNVRDILIEIIRTLKEQNNGQIPTDVANLFATTPRQPPNVVFLYPPNCVCSFAPGDPNAPKPGFSPPGPGPDGTLRPLPPHGSNIPDIPKPISPSNFGCIPDNPGSFPETSKVLIPDGVLRIDPDGNRYWQTYDDRRYPIGEDGKVKTPSADDKVSQGTFETDQYGNHYWIDKDDKVYWVSPDGFVRTVPFIHIPGKFFEYPKTGQRFWITPDGQAYKIDKDGSVNDNLDDPRIQKGKFVTDENNRNWWVDSSTGQKYYIDGNGNILTIKYKGDEAIASIFPGKFWIDENKNRLWIDFDKNQIYYIDPITNKIIGGQNTMEVEKGTFLTDPNGDHWWKSDETGQKYRIDENGNIVTTYNTDPESIPHTGLMWVDQKGRFCIMHPDGTIQILEEDGSISTQSDPFNSSIMTSNGHIVISSEGKIYWVLNNNQRFLVKPDGRVDIDEYCHAQYPSLEDVLQGYFVVDSATYVYWVSPNGYYLLLNNNGYISNTVVLLPGRLNIDYDGKWRWTAGNGNVYDIKNEQVQGFPELQDYFFRYDSQMGYYAISHGKKYRITSAGFIILKEVKNMNDVLELPRSFQSSTPTPNLPPKDTCPEGVTPTPGPGSYSPNTPSPYPVTPDSNNLCAPGYFVTWRDGKMLCISADNNPDTRATPGAPNRPNGPNPSNVLTCPPNYDLTIIIGKHACVPTNPQGKSRPAPGPVPRPFPGPHPGPRPGPLPGPGLGESCPPKYILSWMDGKNVCVPFDVVPDEPTTSALDSCPFGSELQYENGQYNCVPSYPSRPVETSCPPGTVMSWLRGEMVCIPTYLIPPGDPESPEQQEQQYYPGKQCPAGYVGSWINGKRVCLPVDDTNPNPRTPGREPDDSQIVQCPPGYIGSWTNGKKVCVPVVGLEHDNPDKGVPMAPGWPKYPSPGGGNQPSNGNDQSRTCPCPGRPGWDCTCYDDGYWAPIELQSEVAFRKLKEGGNSTKIASTNATLPEQKKP